MTRALVSFFVDGIPVPQGSKTAYVVNGKAVLVDANKEKLKPWRALVKAEAAKARRSTLQGPIVIDLLFVFEQPKSVAREFPAVKPDIDKLVRAVFDALTDARVWGDDGRVVDLHTRKRYGATPGVRVRVGIKEGDEK